MSGSVSISAIPLQPGSAHLVNSGRIRRPAGLRDVGQFGQLTGGGVVTGAVAVPPEAGRGEPQIVRVGVPVVCAGRGVHRYAEGVSPVLPSVLTRLITSSSGSRGAVRLRIGVLDGSCSCGSEMV